MNIERAKEITSRHFAGVRAGEFTKDELVKALQIVREWRYDNDAKYRAEMDKALLIGKSLAAR